MNNSLSNGSSKIDTIKNNYSTDETVIGTWIDGKPIYRKVIVSEDTDFEHADVPQVRGFSHNIDNLDTCVSAQVIMKHKSASNHYPLPNIESNGVVGTAVYEVNSQKVWLKSRDSWAEYKAIIILEYTKTTD